MTFEQAKQAAVKYFESLGVSGLASAKETEDCFIFFGGKKGEKVYGSTGLKIDKATGKQEDFFLPSRENLAILRSAKDLEV